jgi:uncharacterized protein
MKTLAVELPMVEIRDFCRKWRIRELAVFGSVLTDEFDDESDIDFLYTFEENSHWDLFDIIGMKLELEKVLRREVDFIDKEMIEQTDNPYKKRTILGKYLEIYRATRN